MTPGMEYAEACGRYAAFIIGICHWIEGSHHPCVLVDLLESMRDGFDGNVAYLDTVKSHVDEAIVAAKKWEESL